MVAVTVFRRPAMAAEFGGGDGSSAEFMFKSGVFRPKFQLVSRLSHGMIRFKVQAQDGSGFYFWVFQFKITGPGLSFGLGLLCLGFTRIVYQVRVKCGQQDSVRVRVEVSQDMVQIRGWVSDEPTVPATLLQATKVEVDSGSSCYVSLSGQIRELGQLCSVLVRFGLTRDGQT
ncbi:hypothetical protein Hanom_Chr16g01455191 [Helianthus anomalus]